jgi:succinate dehydrogenase / fumarate reductase iron-sulfur subunit
MSTTAREVAGATRRVRVHRFERDGGPARIDEHDVPVADAATVLEALRWIQLHRDPTLALRHSCFHASCGTCGVRVDGRERLACVTRLEDLGGSSITVEPLANLPVLTDLVVDMTSFVERFPDPHPIVRSSESPPHATVPEDIEAYDRFEDCIECGLCLSACPVAATDDTYVGPAALAFAQRMLEEDRGADREALLDWADQDNAAWRCHAAFECTEACPSDVRPAQRIMALRRDLRRRHHAQGRDAPAASSADSPATQGGSS